MLSVLSVLSRNVRYIYGTERAFNTDSMVHKGFTIPIRSRPEGPCWYCEWDYRDASRLCTHGLLSILSWYAEKQFLSSANWASGERSSDITTSSS